MKRSGKKWSVNEILSLQREYELLQMNVDEIAKKHKRTSKAIMYKLHHEGFAKFDWLFHSHPTSHIVPKNDVVIENKKSASIVETIISFILQKIWIPFVKSI
jgi:phosphomevalonate kinase